MNFPRVICILLLTMTCVMARGEDVLDRVDEALSYSAFDDSVRGRFSGLLDLEYYHFSGGPSGLLLTDDHYLLSPRLAMFFDAQIGPEFYLFAHGEVDRGFDPADKAVGARLDEYALRWTPCEDGRFNLQVGRFATVVGNYVERHLSWENPFINSPLIYETATPVYDAEAPPNLRDFAKGMVDAKYDYNPVIWGPSYTTGLSISGRLDKFEYAAELKNAGLSSRPESWDAINTGFNHPTLGARLGWRPDVAWNLGISGSEGAYLTPQALSGLPRGRGLDDFKEKVIGQDISFAWHHWQLWAEMYEARFDVPRVGNADTLGAYVEAKYKFTPSLFGALRLNRMWFGEIPDGNGGEQPWSHDVWRIDAAMTYRLTPHVQVKLQYSLQHEDRVSDSLSHLIATQLTVRF